MEKKELISREIWERCFHHVSYEVFIARPKQRQRAFLSLPWNREMIEKDKQREFVPFENQF